MENVLGRGPSIPLLHKAPNNSIFVTTRTPRQQQGVSIEKCAGPKAQLKSILQGVELRHICNNEDTSATTGNVSSLQIFPAWADSSSLPLFIKSFMKKSKSEAVGLQAEISQSGQTPQYHHFPIESLNKIYHSRTPGLQAHISSIWQVPSRMPIA